MSIFNSIKNWFKTEEVKFNRHGWKRDKLDHRDHYFSLADRGLTVGPLPFSVDLQPQDTPIYDQGQLGSCTGNSISGAYAFDLKKQKLPLFVPSRLFIYFNERKMEGTIGQDAGAQIRDGIKSISQSGVCDETLWPYDVDKFTSQPSSACYTESHEHKSVKYARVNQDETSIKSTLAAGFPIVFGFSVYDAFESPEVAKTGIVPMPGPNDSPIGGHAVMAVGYDSNGIKVRNSWGADWGLNGYFYLPIAYITNQNLADDFWVVEAVT